MDRDYAPSRRRVLAGVAALGATSFGGCVTTGFSADAPDVEGSPVFASFSVKNDVGWGDDKVEVSASLTDRATTDLKVRKLSVVSGSGSEVWSGTVTGGTTSATMFMNVGVPQTVHAFTSTDSPVDDQSVTIDGNSFP